MLKKIADALESVREKTPLVQAITNYVTINDCANILLCFGASPAMCEAKAEVEEFVGIISALYINLGTLTEEQYEAALLAAKKAAQLGKPVVLDPVACGAISRKGIVAKELLATNSISVIKGNIGEIKTLAGFSGKVRGVDSMDDGENAIEACKSLAKEYHTVVAATGKTDIVTDGERTCLIENGSSMLTLITGAGCMAGAITTAAAGAVEDKFVSSAAALLAMSLAGELAENSLEKPLPGSFRVKLIDSIYSLTRDDIMERGKVKCL
jgi:hydroxyethylthiazole kinase